MGAAMNGNDVALGFPRLAAFGFAALVLLGIVAFLGGASAEPQPTWAGLLVVSCYLLGVGLGAAALLALCFVTGARWNATIRPVMARLTVLLPAGAAGVVIVLFARPSLYPLTASTSAESGGSHFQALWLERPFFLARAVVYLALWLALTYWLVQASRRENAHDPHSRSMKPVRVAALFLVVFALTCWLASTDWIMSLEPQWSSTVFGIYHFCGMFLSALAAVIVAVICFDRQGTLGGQSTRDPLRDLGTLLFAFSSFWMYIWFSQYLLIWYANTPDETGYFVLRQQERWQPLFLANLVLNWGVPFVVLLFRPAKESRAVLLLVAVTVLAGRWLDLYLMILPPVAGAAPAFGMWDAGLVVGAIGLAALLLVRRPVLPGRSLAAR
jgi:hypothetical protein